MYLCVCIKWLHEIKNLSCIFHKTKKRMMFSYKGFHQGTFKALDSAYLLRQPSHPYIAHDLPKSRYSAYVLRLLRLLGITVSKQSWTRLVMAEITPVSQVQTQNSQDGWLRCSTSVFFVTQLGLLVNVSAILHWKVYLPYRLTIQKL
jgi:hypothetical protein